MTLLKLTRDQVTPEVSRPDPAKVRSGDPVHTTWNMEVRGNLFAGMWHATAGEWESAIPNGNMCISWRGIRF